MGVPHRILVVGPAWVGDMVMAQSLFQVLKRRLPRSEIDVLAPAWSHGLLEHMPEVAEAITMPVGHGRLDLAARWRLARVLRKRRYQRAILLPNSWKSALVPFWARIPQRTGWRGEMRYGLVNDLRHLDKSRLPMTVQRFVALDDPETDGGQPDGIPPPCLVVDEAKVQQSLQALGLSRSVGKSLLALCPGAEYGPAKRWPEKYYAELARRCAEAEWEVWLFGSSRDQGVCAAVKRVLGVACKDLSGRTTLSQAVDLMSVADAVVSNDSGLMHLAAALDRPLVAIYGSSDPSFTPPLNRRHRIVSLGLGCSPCFERECPLGHTRCLTDISIDQVEQALCGLLNKEATETEGARQILSER